MSRASKGKKFKFKKVFLIISFSIIFLILYVLFKDIYYENSIKSEEEISLSNIVNKENTNDIYVPKLLIEEANDIPLDYKGYPVIASLQIPKIEVDTPIIEDFSKDALYQCVTKYYGGLPNEVGNFCIAGHNSKRKNMFTNLKKLEIGDTFLMSDEKIR